MEKLPSLTFPVCQSSGDSCKYASLSTKLVLKDCQSFPFDFNCCPKENSDIISCTPEVNFSKKHIEPITKVTIPRVAISPASLSEVMVTLIAREQGCQIPECILPKQETSLKTTDLLVDGDGNEYRKRSPFVWQCTKKSDKEKMKKCPALIREKNGKFLVVNSNHRHHFTDY